MSITIIAIDLTSINVVMPGMSGREMMNRIHRLRPELKVLYMSGYTDDAIAHHGILKKGIDYLQKPFSLESLLIKVREVFDKQAEK